MVEDWVLIEAAKRISHASGNLPDFRNWYGYGGTFRALCDMIAKYEQPPVDPLLIEAREIVAKWHDRNCTFRSPYSPQSYRDGERDNAPEVEQALSALRRGIELAEASKA